MRKALLSLVVMLSVLGCSEDDVLSSVVFSTGQDEYPVSATEIVLRLENGSGSAVGYNLCLSRLLILPSRDVVAMGSGASCTTEMSVLSSGQDTQYSWVPAASVAAGEYQFETKIEADGKVAEISTAPLSLVP